jgi:hypothetical protein
MEKPACPGAAAAPALAANWGVLSAEEARTAAALLAAGQAHLFADWPAPGERDDDKKRLLVQARVRCNVASVAAARSEKPRRVRVREHSAAGSLSFADVLVSAPRCCRDSAPRALPRCDLSAARWRRTCAARA